MTPETLHAMTQALLAMARKHAWNKISPPYSYVIRKLDESLSTGLNFHAERKLRNRQIQLAPVLSLEAVIIALNGFYDKIHLIELCVFKAGKKGTILEIFVVEKDDDLRNSKGEPPMLHCKVPIPPYIDSIPKNGIKPEPRKYDINWELGTFEYHWKMFWERLKLRVGIKAMR